MKIFQVQSFRVDLRFSILLFLIHAFILNHVNYFPNTFDFTLVAVLLDHDTGCFWLALETGWLWLLNEWIHLNSLLELLLLCLNPLRGSLHTLNDVCLVNFEKFVPLVVFTQCFGVADDYKAVFSSCNCDIYAVIFTHKRTWTRSYSWNEDKVKLFTLAAVYRYHLVLHFELVISFFNQLFLSVVRCNDTYVTWLELLHWKAL